jgi:hypothetical protein
MAKVENLLATLRGEEPEPEAPPPMAEGGGGVVSAEAVQEAVAPLEARIAELEQRIVESQAPPPMEDAPALEEVPPMEDAPPALEDAPPPSLEPPAEPPAAPTELVMFLQTKMELLEKKLDIAQQEALRANLVLREREQAQHKAQREVEDLFRGIREAQRAQNFDRTLRDHYSSALLRVRELERRLALAQLRMIPAEDVLAHMSDEESRQTLAGRIREQLDELERKTSGEAAESEAEPAGEGAPEPPSPERIMEADAEVAGDRGRAGFESPPPVSPPAPEADLPQIAVLLGRITDLENRLEEAQEARSREADARRHWEENILDALKSTRRQWQKAGGPELLVESALETMTDSLQARDALQTEMNGLVASIGDQPPDSPETAVLRSKLAECRARMDSLQDKLGKQMAIVQAWVKRSREGGDG